MWLAVLASLAACGGGDGAVADDPAADRSTTTAPALLGDDPAAAPDAEGRVAAAEVTTSQVDPRVGVADPCELLEAAAAGDVLGDVGEPVELEDGAACGFEAADGERVALAVVRSDATSFLTGAQASRAVALDDPAGASWVTGAPVVESDLLVVEVGSFAELVVEVSAADRPEQERRALAVAVAGSAIERFAQVEAR
jgi:hypothetical protein